jgi:hypothetical protein
MQIFDGLSKLLVSDRPKVDIDHVDHICEYCKRVVWDIVLLLHYRHPFELQLHRYLFKRVAFHHVHLPEHVCQEVEHVGGAEVVVWINFMLIILFIDVVLL